MREEHLGKIHGIKNARQSPPISHLLFVDDLMIFSRANSNEANFNLSCLFTNFNWSDQRINISKSSMFLSKNCKPSISNSIKSILILSLIPSKAKYIDILLFIHQSKKVGFNGLKDKILSRFSSWKARLLSQATRDNSH